jgi:hypothetical protein
MLLGFQTHTVKEHQMLVQRACAAEEQEKAIYISISNYNLQDNILIKLIPLV